MTDPRRLQSRAAVSPVRLADLYELIAGWNGDEVAPASKSRAENVEKTVVLSKGRPGIAERMWWTSHMVSWWRLCRPWRFRR